MPIEISTPKLVELSKMYEERIGSERKRLSGERVAFESQLGESKQSALLNMLSGKRMIMAGGAIGVLVVAAVGYGTFRTAMRPTELLLEYRDQMREELYDEAQATVTEYFDLKTDDWDTTVEHAQHLLKLGNYQEARTLYARLIARSPLSNDPDILFKSGMSYLPDRTATRIKMTEVLAGTTYVPALIARALLDDQDLERRALRDINAALEELSRIPSDGESYKELQDLTKLFVLNICRNRTFRETSFPEVASFPAGLRSSDLYLFGIDPRMSLNFCVLVPTGPKGYDGLNLDLEYLARGIKAFTLLRMGNREEAEKALAGGVMKDNPINAYINLIIAYQNGDFAAAEEALLDTSYSRQPDMMHYHALVLLLQGPQRWQEGFELMKRAFSVDSEDLQILNNHAVVAMIERRFGQAAKDLDKALQRQNQYAYASYNKGILQLVVDRDISNALLTFQGIANQTRAFPGVRYYYALANIAVENTDNAILMLRDNAKVPHFGVLSKVALADFYSQEYQGDKTAIELYTEAFKEDPSNFEAALKIALVTSRQGKHEQALRGISKIEETFVDLKERDQAPFNELLNAIKGEIYHVQGAERAEEFLAAAVEATENPELYVHLIGLYTSELVRRKKVRAALEITRTALPTDPENIALLVARMEALLAANDVEAAQEVAERATKIDPANLDLLYAKAALFAQAEQWEEATEIYNEIYLQQPTNPQPLADALMMLEEAGGNTALRRQLAEQITRIESQPEQQLQQVEIASTSARTVSPEQAERIREEIEEISSLMQNGDIESYSGLLYRAYLYNQIGEYQPAIKDYLEATKETATENRNGEPILLYEPWHQLASTYIALRQYDKAHDALNNALTYEPPAEEQINMTITRAGVREQLGLLDAAIEDYGTVIKGFPNYYLPYYRRCLLFIEQKQPDLAIDDCTTAIRIDPDSIDAFRARHSAFSQVGDSGNAAKDASKITLLEAQQ